MYALNDAQGMVYPCHELFSPSGYIVKKIVRTTIRIHQPVVFFFDLSSYLAGIIIWINARKILSDKADCDKRKADGVYKQNKEGRRDDEECLK